MIHTLVDQTRIQELSDRIPGIPLFLTVTGSHMWGLSGPESDVDIRGIYALPTMALVDLDQPRDNQQGKIPGNPDLDYQVYEIAKVFRMLMLGNGNIVEMLLSPTTFFSHQEHAHLWQKLGQDFLTQDLARYYMGYYQGQRQRGMATRGGKALVYAYRELMAGTYLMGTGSIVYNFHELWDGYHNTYYEPKFVELALAYMRQPGLSEPGLKGIMDELTHMQDILVKTSANSVLKPGIKQDSGLRSTLRRFRILYHDSAPSSLASYKDDSWIKPKT